MSAAAETPISTVDALQPEAAQALLRFGLALADVKHFLGRRLSEWVTSAPAMEASVALAAITQDELGHARSLYAMLRDIPGAPEQLNPETDIGREVIFAPRALHTPFTSWFQVIAALFVFDQALTQVFEALRESQLPPLKQRAAKILQEERDHAIFARGWVRTLSAKGEPAMRELRAACAWIWPVAVHWFGPPDEASAAALVQAGILRETLPACLTAWQENVHGGLQEIDFRIPPLPDAWSGWRADVREFQK